MHFLEEAELCADVVALLGGEEGSLAASAASALVYDSPHVAEPLDGPVGDVGNLSGPEDAVLGLGDWAFLALAGGVQCAGSDGVLAN